MRDLNAIRQDFDAVDQELFRLFEKRIDLAKEVALLKRAQDLPIYDPEREKQIIERQMTRFEDRDVSFQKAVQRLYELLLSLSREEQQRTIEQENARSEEGKAPSTDQEVTIYTDGACSGNPGPGGYGCILMVNDAGGKTYKKELSGGFSKTTNNRMEILALIIALEQLKKPCRVTLYSDSQYVVKAFTEGWLVKWQRFDWHKDQKKKEPVKNTDLWKRLVAAAEKHEITFVWVKGHAENEFNNRCDVLAVNASMDKAHWQEDEGYKDS